MTKALVAGVCVALGSGCLSTPPDFARIRDARVALTHVAIVDGTGGAPTQNQTIVIDQGRIVAIGPADQTTPPPDTRIVALGGHTVIPGLVGMHDHLFYAVDGGRGFVAVPRAFAHLYLASGVTTIRTAGTLDLAQDIAVKREIEAGRETGPKIHLSSPYVHDTSDIARLIREINTMADEGVTTLKVYTDVRRDVLAAAIDAAHRRGMRVTGHLCAVGFRQAAAAGIDNLEHGLIVDSEFYSGRVTDHCPDWTASVIELAGADVESAPIQGTIHQLVSHGVAVTSTLAVFETFLPRRAFFDDAVGRFLTERAAGQYRREIASHGAQAEGYRYWDRMLVTEMAFERSFVRAGGLLMAGADPTGWGGTIAGVADQRNVELLAQAGFTIPEVIRIATLNGAAFLGESGRIGTVERGKQADLVVLRGDLASDVRTIRNVELVFKDGIGFDPAKLAGAERGRIGAVGFAGTSLDSGTAIRIAVGIAVCSVLLLAIRDRVRRGQRARRKSRSGEAGADSTTDTLT